MTPDQPSRDDDLQVSALSSQAPRIWRLWTNDTRLWTALVTLVALVALVVVGMTLRARSASAEPAACSGALTITILSELPAIGLQLYPTRNVALVSEQSALAVAYKVMSPRLLADATCLVARVLRVQVVTDPSMKVGEDLWAVAYHVPGKRNSSTVFGGFPIDIWTFVDATSGAYISAATALTP
ncbi:MAG: hypothetical protein KGO05_07935 [Chloroflexota bacterium]|nr:hypothetical protein [Chloroflexota bacterium]